MSRLYSKSKVVRFLRHGVHILVPVNCSVEMMVLMLYVCLSTCSAEADVEQKALQAIRNVECNVDVELRLIMVALWNRETIYIFILWFVLLLLLLLLFPRLISSTADWMSAILPHMVWP